MASTQVEAPVVEVGVKDSGGVEVEVKVAVGVAVGDEVSLEVAVMETVPIGVEEEVALNEKEGVIEGNTSVLVLVGVKINSPVGVMVVEEVNEGMTGVEVGVGVKVFDGMFVGEGVEERETKVKVLVTEGLIRGSILGVPVTAVGVGE